VPRVGLEPTRLAAGDFESDGDLSTGAGCKPIPSAKDLLKRGAVSLGELGVAETIQSIISR
jgi:hypothetical protein